MDSSSTDQTDGRAMTTAFAQASEHAWRGLVRAGAVWREWRRSSRSRRELAALDDHQLRDLGLTRSQALFEAAKPFFRK